MFFRWLSFIALLFCLHQTGLSQPSNTGTLQITFQPRYAGQPLVLDTQLYHLPTGDTLFFDVLRFYVSSIQLHGNGIQYQEKAGYHLIDAAAPGSWMLVLKDVPASDYQTLQINIGTDSLANVSGAMGGDLDPTLGMYWAWNSGYINFKVEGRSSASPNPDHAFEFHVGGYKAPYQTVRQVVFPLKRFHVAANATALVSIDADLDKFFKYFQLNAVNRVVMPSKAAAQLADYFRHIFTME